MTLTYFTAKSNLFKITYCANIRPMRQMSIKKTIDPPVSLLLINVKSLIISWVYISQSISMDPESSVIMTLKCTVMKHSCHYTKFYATEK